MFANPGSPFFFRITLRNCFMKQAIISLTYHRAKSPISSNLASNLLLLFGLNKVCPQKMRAVNIQNGQKNGYWFRRHFQREESLILWTRYQNLSKISSVIERDFEYFYRVATLSGQRLLDCVKSHVTLLSNLTKFKSIF